MKKIITIIFLIFVLILITYFGYISIRNHNTKKQIEKQIQTLPPFAFNKLSDGSLFTNDSLNTSQMVLILYFDPECDFCHKQLEEISKNIEKFSNFQLLLISSAKKSEIQTITDTYRLSDKPNIVILHDADYIFDDIFGKSGIPTSLVYDTNNQLLKKFKGLVNTQKLYLIEN